MGKNVLRFAGAMVLAAGCASASAVAAAPNYRTLSATFNPIGDAPLIEWIPDSADPRGGTIRSIDTHGAPSVLLNFDVDPELDALGDLEATMQVGGSFFSYLPDPLLRIGFSFYYAGDTPFTVGGLEYTKGTRLLSFFVGMYQYTTPPNYGYTFDLGPFYGSGVGTGIAGFGWSVSSYGSLSLDTYPDTVPSFHGRQLVQQGEGIVSGSVTGIYVPEPTTWALLLLGFGGIGAMLRRQRAAIA